MLWVGRPQLLGKNWLGEGTGDFADNIRRLGGLVDQLKQIPLIGPLFEDVRLADYESVGELRFINWSNEIEPDSLLLERQRDLHLVWIIWRQQFDRFHRDHDIQCKSEPGYMGTVCPVGVCS